VEGVCALPGPGGIGIWQEGRWHTQLHGAEARQPEARFLPGLVAYTRQALEASVQAHLLADVPGGLFLSGGQDSAAGAGACEPLAHHVTKSLSLSGPSMHRSRRRPLARHYPGG